MTFEFALNVIAFAHQMKAQRKHIIADQLLRSGCSIGANVKEAQGAESRADFIHKMKLALKEAEETEYWLQLCEFSPVLLKPSSLPTEVEAIIKVLNKIVASAKRGSKEFTTRRVSKLIN